jgi:hypothetical protein
MVPADSVDAIELLRRMGFHLGPPVPVQTEAPLQRRAWLDAGDAAFTAPSRALN